MQKCHLELSSIQIAEKKEASAYYWSNPRRICTMDDGHARGLTPEELEELKLKLKSVGLVYPLLCRKVDDKIEVVDGERRLLCLREIVEKDEECWDSVNNKKVSGKELYSTIPCIVMEGSEKDALKMAISVTEGAVPWSEGTLPMVVKNLRACGCTDDEILQITKKRPFWLKTMDELCSLDDYTFQYLIDGKINKQVAHKLFAIKDLDARKKYLEATFQDAVKNVDDAGIERAIVKAESKSEFLEAQKVEAVLLGKSTETIEQEIQEVEKEIQEKKKKKSKTPQGRMNNLRNVIEEEDKDLVCTALTVPKMKKQIEEIKSIISNGNDDDDTPLMVFRVAEAVIKSIIIGEEDIVETIKKAYNKHLALCECSDDEKELDDDFDIDW